MEGYPLSNRQFQRGFCPSAASVMPGVDCRRLLQPGPQEASGHIHVNLDSGSPCRNDELSS